MSACVRGTFMRPLRCDGNRIMAASNGVCLVARLLYIGGTLTLFMFRFIIVGRPNTPRRQPSATVTKWLATSSLVQPRSGNTTRSGDEIRTSSPSTATIVSFDAMGVTLAPALALRVCNDRYSRRMPAGYSGTPLPQKLGSRRAIGLASWATQGTLPTSSPRYLRVLRSSGIHGRGARSSWYSRQPSDGSAKCSREFSGCFRQMARCGSAGRRNRHGSSST